MRPMRTGMMLLRDPRGSGVIRRVVVSCGPLLVLAVAGCHQASPARSPPTSAAPVPVYQEPMHRLVYRNPLVRVLDVRIAPGDTTAYHVHSAPMVGVAVQDARIWTQALGGEPGPIAASKPTPAVFTNWSQPLPYTHRVANVDRVPLHYLVAEWLARAGREVPAFPDDETRRLIEESPTVRVYRITLEPRAATWPHTHVGPGLVVLGTDGTLRDDGGPHARGGVGAGSWSWREGPYRHRLRNDGRSKLVVYEIDWR
jgi:quercetin dioxygenase-like cupin family protein